MIGILSHGLIKYDELCMFHVITTNTNEPLHDSLLGEGPPLRNLLQVLDVQHFTSLM